MTDTMPAPSPWIRRFLPLAEPGETALDLACGGGRHTELLIDSGYDTTAVDLDVSKLGPLKADIIEADLENNPWPFPGRIFDVIIVTRYLHRPLFPQLAASLSPTGILLYETFMVGHEEYGRPSNPAFLLRPNELLQAFHPKLTPIAFEQGLETDATGQRVIQRLAARNRHIITPLSQG